MQMMLREQLWGATKANQGRQEAPCSTSHAEEHHAELHLESVEADVMRRK